MVFQWESCLTGTWVDQCLCENYNNFSGACWSAPPLTILTGKRLMSWLFGVRINNLLSATLAEVGNTHWVKTLPATKLSMNSSVSEIHWNVHYTNVYTCPPCLFVNHHFPVSTEITILEPDLDYLKCLACRLATKKCRIHINQLTQSKITVSR